MAIKIVEALYFPYPHKVILKLIIIPQLLYLIPYFAKKRCKTSTKLKVITKYWSQDAQSVKRSVNYSTGKTINEELLKQRDIIEKIYHNILEDYNRQPDTKELIDAFRKEYFENSPFFTSKKTTTISSVIDEYIKTMKVEGKEISAEKYSQIKKNLQDFAKSYRKSLAFESINMDFRADLLDYFTNVLQYKQTTLHRKMKFIKTIFLYAIASGYVKLDHFNMNLSKWGIEDGEAENIALTPDELKEIERLDLSDMPHLDRVRDRFLIGCYIGARFSDFIRINAQHIKVVDGKEYISFKQDKTGEIVTQPFWPELKRIFEKYKYTLPVPITNQKFNEYLSIIATKCTLLQKKMELTEVIRGKKTKTMVTRASMVSSHSARRTFATINANRGIDLEVIAIGTGHKSIAQLKHYIKASDVQKANILENAFNRINQTQ